MIRNRLNVALAIIVSVIIWFASLKIGFYILGTLWDDYAIAHISREFSKEMLVSRLLIFSLTIAATSGVASFIARHKYMPIVAGVVIFMASVPDHLWPGYMWDDFPSWYHYAYLALILPIAYVAGRIGLARL